MRLTRCLAVVVVVIGGACSTNDHAISTPATSATSPPASASSYRLLYLSRFENSTTWHLEARLPSEPTSTRVPTPEGADIAQPDVTIRGDRVVYLASVYDGPREVWTTDIGHLDSVPAKVPASEPWDCVRWMPDGQHLLVVRQEPDPEVAILDSVTGTNQPVGIGVTAEAVGCGDPSPDGRSFAIATAARPDAPLREVVDVDIATGASTPIGSLPEGCIANNPSWAPAGDILATDAICERPEHNGIWLLAPTGGSPRKLVGENPPDAEPSNDNLQYWAPAWTPSGDALVYYRAAPSFSPPEVRTIGVDGHNDRRVIEPRSSFPVAAALNE